MENPVIILLIIIILLILIDIIVHLITANKNNIQTTSTIQNAFNNYRQENNNTLLTINSNMQANLSQHFQQVDTTLTNNAIQEEAKLEFIRSSMQTSLNQIRTENNEKLEEMRKTVDEKLQKTLESKLSESFKTVSERLQEVYQGLGEMRALASGVGDLKKVLSNVKTRGILGEIQLGAILKEIMPKEQYDENINTIPGSSNRVEFAIKLPNEDNGFIYLPIDSKFPNDTYSHLLDALDSGNKELIDQARAGLTARLKSEAKDIHSKYISIPYTTEFAIMFLPTEGLYSEACNLNMMETLQHDYQVTIAGPSTMAAILNSLQLGFKTLAIQKRSSEVWDLLASVKSEFETFGDVLSRAQKNIQQTSEEIDKLVGVRTRAINRKLREVQSNKMYNLDNKDLNEED